jgi:hypothetical protein
MNLTLQHRNIDFDFSNGGLPSKNPRHKAAEIAFRVLLPPVRGANLDAKEFPLTMGVKA